jgi:hypothetical protein
MMRQEVSMGDRKEKRYFSREFKRDAVQLGSREGIAGKQGGAGS